MIIQSVLIKTCRQDKYKLVDWRIIGSHGRCRGKLSFNYHSWGTGMILLGPLSHLGMMIRLIGLAARMIGLAADWSAWQHDGKERLFPMMVEIVPVSSDGEENEYLSWSGLSCSWYSCRISSSYPLKRTDEWNSLLNGIMRIVEHCDSLLNIVIRYNGVVNGSLIN